MFTFTIFNRIFATLPLRFYENSTLSLFFTLSEYLRIFLIIAHCIRFFHIILQFKQLKGNEQET
ncbi:hypothetical protein X975_15144, partial [Stegodyphus mimosarum]